MRSVYADAYIHTYLHVLHFIHISPLFHFPVLLDYRKDLDSYAHALRNKWAFVSTKMPINGHNGHNASAVLERLRAANAITTAMKNSPLAGVWCVYNIMWLILHVLFYRDMCVHNKCVYTHVFFIPPLVCMSIFHSFAHSLYTHYTPTH